MARKLLVLAVVLAVLALVAHADDVESQEETEITCPKKREEYNACGNKCEEARCNPPKEPLDCTACKPGCYCKKGSSRNDFNNCVPTSMCNYKNYIG
ncbi:protease inhibitor Sg8C3 [Anopheles sinensis]|uniref:Protease inhibitor Sg8C3 n=1 Tax=Anopheles sinensis TaxID=74873 RepID=A0A084W6A7_ANOSI|nr:protease inhibitor Sg8C3 [Anopheles sinensis]